jgi:hypothetical protein
MRVLVTLIFGVRGSESYRMEYKMIRGVHNCISANVHLRILYT